MTTEAKKQKNELDLLNEISHKLDVLIATNAAYGKETDKQIEIYESAGLNSEETGKLMGMEGNAIRQRKHKLRKKG